VQFRPSLLNSLLAIPLLIGTGGCSGMPVERCASQDWYAQGYQDAANGLSTEQFLTYHNSCALHGITPHRTRYLSGWVDGREISSRS